MRAVIFINIPEDAYKTSFIYQKLQYAASQKGLELNIEVEGFEGREPITDEEISNSQIAVIISDTEFPTERFVDIPIIKVTSDEALRDIERIYNMTNKSQELSDQKYEGVKR